MQQPEHQTPLMAQYQTIKAEYPECLLLFQVGDFYELFFEDAKKAASFLGIALTKRGKSQGMDIPLCGVPLHTIDHYIHKLVKAGFKVALCNQLETPRPGTVVKRGVTRVLTPGTLTDDTLLSYKKSSYMCVVVKSGLIFAELLTTRLVVTSIDHKTRTLENELSRFFPDEIIVDKKDTVLAALLKKNGYAVSLMEQESLDTCNMLDCDAWLVEKCSSEVHSEIMRQDDVKTALFYFYVYMHRMHQAALSCWERIDWYNSEAFLAIDHMTQKNLELVVNQAGGSEKTLFSCIDYASTPMGSRLIKQWLMRPLMNQAAIEQRQQAIGLLQKNVIVHNRLQQFLESIGDLERVVGRILIERASQYDFIALQKALHIIPQFFQTINDLQAGNNQLFVLIMSHYDNLESVTDILSRGLHTDTTQNFIIKVGFDQELDAMRSLMQHGNQEILALEKAEQESTGISSLKVRYNDVYGYFLETTKLGATQIPAYYKPLQSLVGKERFTIPALEILQYNIERAKKQSIEREKLLFDQIKKVVVAHGRSLRRLVFALANCDAISGLALAAQKNQWVCPLFVDHPLIHIKQGWHPIVACHGSTRFIPNDTALHNQQLMLIITGPNMGGKSTYLRQVALIAILAHMGSFVPAQKADLMLMDRIFSRIGAGDNVAQGKSTFLVEMEETALICQEATDRSLVILDEVGRGTSTHDGIALAQAIIEFLVTERRCLTLFATHYHALTELTEQYSYIKAFFAASIESNGSIIFLYQIIPGVAVGSFGLQVARLAMLPSSIVDRAAFLLANTYIDRVDNPPAKSAISHEHTPEKMILDRVVRLLRAQDIADLTPRQAFDLVWQLQDLIS